MVIVPGVENQDQIHSLTPWVENRNSLPPHQVDHNVGYLQVYCLVLDRIQTPLQMHFAESKCAFKRRDSTSSSLLTGLWPVLSSILWHVHSLPVVPQDCCSHCSMGSFHKHQPSSVLRQLAGTYQDSSRSDHSHYIPSPVTYVWPCR